MELREYIVQGLEQMGGLRGKDVQEYLVLMTPLEHLHVQARSMTITQQDNGERYLHLAKLFHNRLDIEEKGLGCLEPRLRVRKPRVCLVLATRLIQADSRAWDNEERPQERSIEQLQQQTD